jgi:L-2-hydroxyglutarate oxidase
MREIEPRAKTFERAIFSPTTSTADPLLVIESMRADAIAEGVRIEQNSGYLRRKGSTIFTKSGEIEAGYVVNAAGLYADKVARDFGFSEHYRIVPFKGIYLYSEEPAGAFRTNIYPVPDLRNPFLGVHFTVTVDGHAKIGPTAIPAFWREQYGAFEGFEPAEFLEIVSRELGLLMFSGFDFKRLAVEELLKYSKPHLVSLAAQLAENVRVSDYKHWGRPGIRAQLMDTRTRKLEMDFVLESNEKSMHVLNAVSPGWTCAIPFAQFVVDKIDASVSGSFSPQK